VSTPPTTQPRVWLRPSTTATRLHLFTTDAEGNITNPTALCCKSFNLSPLALAAGSPSPVCRMERCRDCEEKVRQEQTGQPTTKQRSTRDLMRGLKAGRGARPLPWVERFER